MIHQLFGNLDGAFAFCPDIHNCSIYQFSTGGGGACKANKTQRDTNDTAGWSTLRSDHCLCGTELDKQEKDGWMDAWLCVYCVFACCVVNVSGLLEPLPLLSMQTDECLNQRAATLLPICHFSFVLRRLTRFWICCHLFKKFQFISSNFHQQ